MSVLPAARNIELKARCADLGRAKRSLAGLSLREGGVQQQIDTYFVAPNGRLKLREIVGVKAELIWYDRSDEARSRESNYRIASVSSPVELKAVLTAGLGLRGEVRKRREILLWDNVRIHLDEVEELGGFVEFEAVISTTGDEGRGHGQLAELCGVMSLEKADYLMGSYSDLLGL